MNRPTQESLDESLEHAKGLLVYEIAKTRELLPSELALLDCAAEVLALREKLMALQPTGRVFLPVPADASSQMILEHYPSVLQELARFRATLARVQALPNQFNEAADRMQQRDLPGYAAVRVCADELEAAIKGVEV